MHLCPAEACEFAHMLFLPNALLFASHIDFFRLDCPNGHRSEKPLFLQKDAFEGEQWAPWSRYNNEEPDFSNSWIMVGTLNGNASSTCHKYQDLNNGNSPQWTLDDSHTGLKEHILCCLDQSLLATEESLSRGLNTIWLDQSHGWNGGSYSEAEQFCEGLGGKKLCPYSACECVT
jgi:hypothetical protein